MAAAGQAFRLASVFDLYYLTVNVQVFIPTAERFTSVNRIAFCPLNRNDLVDSRVLSSKQNSRWPAQENECFNAFTFNAPCFQYLAFVVCSLVICLKLLYRSQPVPGRRPGRLRP